MAAKKPTNWAHELWQLFLLQNRQVKPKLGEKESLEGLGSVDLASHCLPKREIFTRSTICFHKPTQSVFQCQTTNRLRPNIYTLISIHFDRIPAIQCQLMINPRRHALRRALLGHRKFASFSGVIFQRMRNCPNFGSAARSLSFRTATCCTVR